MIKVSAVALLVAGCSTSTIYEMCDRVDSPSPHTNNRLEVVCYDTESRECYISFCSGGGCCVLSPVQYGPALERKLGQEWNSF